MLVASVEMPDETRASIMVPTSPWQRRWRELLANAPTLASWFFVRPVAASVSDFLDSIRSSPRPQLASARVSGLANDILAGHTCAIQPSGSAWVARMRHPTDPSAGTQMRVLSNEEAVSLREFCVWHDGYKARGGVDVDLPTFVGPRGLVAAATYVSPPRPAEDEVRQSMAEAIVGCAGRPRELWIDVGQTYDGAEVTLHCDGRQGDVVLEGLDFTAGALARFRDARRRGSFRSALDDVVQILSAEPLRTALARCHARNAAFQYLVTGPYDERRAARHPSLL